jgi:uncharacterized Fe-S center protein
MEKSKVYFTDFKATPEENLPQKLERLVLAAGFGKINFKNKYAAIKIHFGEPGNLAYLRPNYAGVLARLVKKKGGRPFLTDCATLYVGRRKNALEHLESAYENGFSPFAVDCHILIGDGLKGTDEALIPINGDFVKEARIGRAVADADIIISLNHFKVHELTGIGGALKNIGMGCGSRAGKMDMHASGKPSVEAQLCIGCASCIKNCANDGIVLKAGKAWVDEGKCAGCGRCIGVCPEDALSAPFDSTNEKVNRKIAEYAAAVVKGKPNFHVTLICDVSPFCDCHSENDRAIVADVGMLASFDPVALDTACADLVNKQPPLPNSLLAEVNPKGDYFTAIHPTTDWRTCVDQAVKIGLGNSGYELVSV